MHRGRGGEEHDATTWDQQGRKAQTRGGGRQAGAPSRWMVAPLPGKMGGEKRVKIEREAVLMGER